MKQTQLIVASSIVSSLLIIPSAKAEVATSASYIPQTYVLAQKNCVPGELTMSKNGGQQTVTTTCTWLKQRTDAKGNLVLDAKGQLINEEPDMQVTLYVDENIKHIKGRCAFNPTIDDEGKHDKVADVATSEAGSYSPRPAKPDPLYRTHYHISPHYKGGVGSQVIDLAFSIYHYKEFYDESKKAYRANVIFELNINGHSRWDKTPLKTPFFNYGDKISCEFMSTETLELPK